MPKNVQISFDLFLQLVRYHYFHSEDEQLQGSIEKGIQDKLEAMIKHDLYSVYSNKQLSDAERDAARREYLDRIGLRDSFRWDGVNGPPHP